MSKPGQHVLVTLRKMIAAGEIAAGARLAEIPTAAQLGVSRMPVRVAFRELEQEGLLVKTGARGFTVRSVTPAEIVDAVEVRGVLEGLAARQLAERGAGAAVRLELEACLADGDALMAKGYLGEEDAVVYLDMNIRFHRAIVEGAGNIAVMEALARNDHLPFASVKALAIDRQNLQREFQRLNYAHMQHHAIAEALAAGQSARVEALMREHASAVLCYTDIDPACTGLTILRG